MKELKLKQKQKVFPESYTPKLSMLKTHQAITLVQETFEKELSKELDLVKIACPRFIKTGRGLQDDLAGTQTPVGFTLKHGDYVEVVHSLAKWKRFTLGKLETPKGKGIITIMDAFRKDEDLSPIHSSYVDQWDWEKVIGKEDRTLKFLKKTVEKIYYTIRKTESKVAEVFPELKISLPEKIHFVHAEELEERYPMLSSKEREHRIAKEYGAVFLIGIGHPLKSGIPHDVRAADYDDWSTPTSSKTKGLDGDIVVWDKVREKSLELSSMGIRVDKKALEKQLEMVSLSHRKRLEFHKGIMKETLPLTIGGGIGRSRVAMFLLQKAHIGEVQSSVWPRDIETEFKKKQIELL